MCTKISLVCANMILSTAHTSEGRETSALEYLMRQIQICFDFFVGTLFPLKRSKIDFTKIVKVDLDSLCQELSNSGLESAVTLLVRWQIDFLSARIGRPIQL